jgi:filamentous hemagglutinin
VGGAVAGKAIKALVKKYEILGLPVSEAVERAVKEWKGTNGGKLPNISGGTANAATVKPLKDQLIQEDLVNIGKIDDRLAVAVQGSGTKNPNFSIGSATQEEAHRLGMTWVGDGAKLIDNQISCPGCWKSADGTRLYRPPTLKPTTPFQFNPTGVQANFVIMDGKNIVSNGHLIIRP